jgi:hypothetical protein
MKKNWYNILPWIALSSGVLLVLLVIAAIIFKPQQNIENTENKKIVFDKLKQISLESKDMLNRKAFFDYVNKTINCNVINTIWIINQKGEIVYAKGLMAASTPLNATVYSLIDDQNRGLINAVEGSIDTVQKQVISIAAAIRREGEHNDIYGHLVMPLKSNQVELAGFIGVAYSLENDSEPSVAIFIIIDVALIICFLVYWLSIPFWVYFDSRKRNDKYILWTIFVLIGNLPAYIAYLLSRK